MKYRVTRRISRAPGDDEYFIRLRCGIDVQLSMCELAWLNSAKEPVKFTRMIQYLGEVMEHANGAFMQTDMNHAPWLWPGDCEETA